MDKLAKEEVVNLNIGLLVIALFAIIIVVFKWQRNVWADAEDTDYTVYATFNRTDGLSVGNKVRLAGVDVGRVEGSVLDENFRATLTLKIRHDIKIPDDSSAAIVSSGIMGNKYIEIEPGGSEDFIEENGDFVYTQDAIVLEELIERIIALGKAKRKNSAETPATTQKMENEDAQETD
ncbi:MAG: outer membrane lipid asymmetry maintenance protein MlaD [Alphaproteobacteria bacterium]|nr:outer membrane lipid asymmetry maintenance protein MlaD [Alphaproteobacteria bacterium]